jgi:hypothetical protein
MNEQEKAIEEYRRKFQHILDYDPAIGGQLEDIISLLSEGINVDKVNRTVEYDSSHERGVVTGNCQDIPLPLYSSTEEGYPVISIFERTEYEKTESGDMDGNPLLYAAKRIYGWKFKNGDKDIYSFFRRFVNIAHGINRRFDAVIKIPSQNELNNRFLHLITRIIDCGNIIKKDFAKLFPSQVYELINYKLIKEENPNDWQTIGRQLEYAIGQQEKTDKWFTFKEIPPKYRKYIGQIFEQSEPMIDLSQYINDKDILILDDTISEGTTISRMCECVLDLYVPKSITIITLFSSKK